jgi:hypothetical protein
MSAEAVLWSCRLDGRTAGGTNPSVLSAAKPSTPIKEGAVTKAQEVYERVEALVASGLSKADAFRQVAEEYGKPFNSMRGAYYAHTRTLGTSPANPRKRDKPASDPIASATNVLEKALGAIDAEVAAAKTRVEQAKTEYEHLRDTASERKATIQAKIEALKA